jgi:Ca2+-binding EF-hand superfamily protein
MSAKTNFFRGAIAVAANGIPIFNPIKNDGRTDTFLAGELDQYGGHAGRADDYHYHVAPWHLAEKLGPNLPLAYALDGYPIYGLNEPDGSPATGLDSFHGHTNAMGGYHYHASRSYPYINGGFYGQVSVRGGGVDPQPDATPVREATFPLPGAKITGFEVSQDQNKYRVEYEQGGKKGSVAYQVFGNRQVQFVFTNPDGTTREQTGVQGRQSKGGGDRPAEGPKGEPKDGRGPPRENDPNRKPWIENHISEMDSDRNGKLSKEEMMTEVKKVFEGYDGNDDGKITEKEANERGVHSAMAGFIQQHFAEVDADKDGAISLQELKDASMRMWEKYAEGSIRGSKRPPPPQN